MKKKMASSTYQSFIITKKEWIRRARKVCSEALKKDMGPDKEILDFLYRAACTGDIGRPRTAQELGFCDRTCALIQELCEPVAAKSKTVAELKQDQRR